MKVGISNICDERGAMIPFQGEQEILETERGFGIQINSPVAVKGKITNTGEGFLVQCQLNFTFQAECARCLEFFTGNRVLELSEQFFANYTGDDDTVFTFEGERLDLTTCINEQLWSVFPIKFLCSSECLGICAHCGKNLNKERCQCHTESINPQFANLKELLSKKEVD